MKDIDWDSGPPFSEARENNKICLDSTSTGAERSEKQGPNAFSVLLKVETN